MKRDKETIRYTEGQTPVGEIFVASTDRGLCALRLLEGKNASGLVKELRGDYPEAEFVADAAGLKTLVQQINAVLAGELSAGKIKLDMPGTPFQQEVWQELVRVRRGQTCSYSELARRVGRPRAVRAVASACARNPVALIVPCHRILRNDGGLGGYYYGLERKRQILRLEKVMV